MKSADFVVDRIGSKCVRTIFPDDCYHIVTMDNERELVASETSNFFMENIGEKSSGLRFTGRARLNGIPTAVA